MTLSVYAVTQKNNESGGTTSNMHMKKIILFAFGLLSIIFILSMLKHKTARAIMDTMECYPHV